MILLKNLKLSYEAAAHATGHSPGEAIMVDTAPAATKEAKSPDPSVPDSANTHTVPSPA